MPAGQLEELCCWRGEPTGGRQALSRRQIWGEARDARSPWCPVGEGPGRLRSSDGAWERRLPSLRPFGDVPLGSGSGEQRSIPT